MSLAMPIVRSIRRVDLVAGVGQTVFTFPYPLLDTADLAVLQSGVPATLFSPPAGPYTVALVSGNESATVTFAVAPVAILGAPNVTIRLAGAAIAQNVTDVTRGGSVSSVAINQALDRIIMVEQELRRDISDIWDTGTLVGSIWSEPTANIQYNGAQTYRGLISGHIRISDTGADPIDAFVGIYGDEYYQDIGQEMRGVTYTLRNTRTVPDDPTLGWDSIPGSFSSVITQYNTQYIRGNMKAVVGEIIAQSPLSGNYSARSTYNFQTTTIIGANVILENHAGIIIGTPITEENGYDNPVPVPANRINYGYGIIINPTVGGVDTAAINLIGQGNSGRIRWPTTSVSEDTSGKLQLSLGNNYLSLQNGLTTATVSSTVPVGWLKVIIGGNGYGIPFVPL